MSATWKVLRTPFFTLLLTATLTISSFGQQITIKGSDTMLQLSQHWTQQYAVGKSSTLSFVVLGGGSSKGIAALSNGTTTIAAASRRITDSERKEILANRGKSVNEVPVGFDAVAIYVHASNPVSQLTTLDLKRIFVGEIQNWSEVGGRKAPINIYGREYSSGTRAFIQERILESASFSPSVKEHTTNVQLLSDLMGDPNGIGYASLEFTDIGARVLAVADKGTAYKPSATSIRSGKYPLTRTLYYYVVGEPTGEVRHYLDWVRSAKGRAIVEAEKFVPFDTQMAIR